jgi:hypothetical protein
VYYSEFLLTKGWATFGRWRDGFLEGLHLLGGKNSGWTLIKTTTANAGLNHAISSNDDSLGLNCENV